MTGWQSFAAIFARRAICSLIACAAMPWAPQAAARATDEDVATPPAAIEIVRAPGLSAVSVSKAADAPGRAIDVARPRLHGPGKARPVQPGSVAARPPQAMLVTGGRITSGMGLRWHPILGGVRIHSGVDLAANPGTPVYATSDGLIRVAGWGGGYGLLVVVDHPGGLQSRYGHLLRLAVAPGQQVRAGQLLGLVGSTGRSTGPHLHYELRYQGVAFDPVLRRQRN